MAADTKRGAGCDYPASWCLFPGCEKCRDTHPGLGRLAAQGLHVVTTAEKAVLEAMARVPKEILKAATSMYGHLAPSMDDLKAPVLRELARREAAK